jgi:hypothetical protein
MHFNSGLVFDNNNDDEVELILYNCEFTYFDGSSRLFVDNSQVISTYFKLSLVWFCFYLNNNIGT